MHPLSQLFRFLRGAPSRARPNRILPSLELLEDRSLPSGILSLGAAAQYGVLGLQNTQILNSNVAVAGDEGVSQGGKLTNMAPSTITGNADEYAAGQYSGPGKLGGSVVVNPTLLSQSDSDALSAAAQAAALTPTQTLGMIGGPTTVTGNGGLNVIQVNGDIRSSLILNGTSSDVFVVNVTGSVSLGGGTTLGLAGGVTADHVLYNFTGAGGSIATHVGNVLNGTLLAPTYSFNLDGLFNGEIIGGGTSITLLSGARVNEVPLSSPASLSGFVFNGNTGAGLAGVTVTLTYTNARGQTVTATAVTAADGSYSFAGLPPGTFTVSASLAPGFTSIDDQVGTVNGAADGASLSGNTLGQINLSAGDASLNYDFLELFGGS